MERFTFALAPTLAGRSVLNDNVFRPLVSYLERALGMTVSFVMFGSYDETIAALRNGTIDAASLGDLASQAALADGGVEPLLAVSGSNEHSATYRSALITRHDSGIQSIERLVGATIGLVDGMSTSGYTVPRTMLREAKIDPDRQVTIRLFPSHQDVVEAVIAGEVDAAATHEMRLTPPSLERGPDYARLRVIARSREIPRGPLVVRTGLPKDVRERLVDAMSHVHERDPEAAKVLLQQGNRFTVPQRRSTPTLKSIAALAGVSYATVSRVINDSGYVAPDTRERVQAIIDEVGYAPNGNARVLLGRQFPLVGVVVSLNSAEFLVDLERLRPSFERARIPLVICPVGSTLGESQVPQILRDRRLGAIVVDASMLDDADVIRLAQTGHLVFALADVPVPQGVLATSLESIVHDLVDAVNPAFAEQIG